MSIPVFTRDSQTLISMGKGCFDVNEEQIRLCKTELLGRRQERRNEGFTWGYLLGLELNDVGQFPIATRFIQDLLDQIKGWKEGHDFDFSFCKVCSARSSCDSEGVHYEGMHLDTHPKLVDSHELLRMLFNFSEHPRQFRYARTDRHELAQRGVGLNRTDYKTLLLPGNIETAVVEIPARRGHQVHYLKFWASVVPHVGITEDHGYFLISFEAVRNRMPNECISATTINC